MQKMILQPEDSSNTSLFSVGYDSVVRIGRSPGFSIYACSRLPDPSGSVALLAASSAVTVAGPRRNWTGLPY